MKRYNYLNTDWQQFRTAINENIKLPLPPILTTNDLDEADANLLQAIHAARDQTVPSYTQRDLTDRRRRLPQYIIDIIKQKRRAYRLYTKCRTDSNRKLLRTLQQDVQNAIQHHENSKRHKIIEQIEKEHKQTPIDFWKTIKRLQGKSNYTNPPLKIDNQIILADQDKANAFSKTLYDTFQTPNDTKPNKHHKQVEYTITKYKKWLNPLTNTTSQLNPPPTIAHDELNKALHRTRNKAPGPDGIPYIVYKNLPPNATALLLRIYNTSIILGHLPKRWKQASILMFPKTGKDNSKPENYRPISLTPTIVKILERILANRLHPLIRDKIPLTQAGFRPQFNITDQLLRLITHLQDTAWNRGHTITTLALDVSKAFDTVWLDGLRYKLLTMQLPTYLTRWASDYIRERTAHVKIRNTISNEFELRAGTPQGGVLSPILYILYVADIPQPTAPYVGLSQFADDTLYWTSGQNIQTANGRLKQQTSLYLKWAKNWKVKINATKSQALATKRNPIRLGIRDKFDITIGPETIKYKNQIKYLGYILDTKLTPKAHYKHVIKNTRTRAKFIYTLANNTYKAAPPNITLHLYKALIRPYILYAAPLLIHNSHKEIKSLEIIERTIIRRAHELPRWTPKQHLYSIANITRLRDYLNETTKRYWTQAKTRPTLKTIINNIPNATTIQLINDL
jgi:Reverse transcriptase (RNA-dependent DNA polymerase).